MISRAERIEFLKATEKEARNDNSKLTLTIKNWRGKPDQRKIVRIDSEYLMFRIENSRTEIQQLTYIRKHNLPKNFFNDPESAKVQEAQEEILLDMVRGKGKEMLEDLRNRGQEDPCIITYDGFLVNGNRRTAALKSIGERYIDCAILPADALAKDIYNLEQQLQIARDFREDYHWINELRNIKKGIEELNIEEDDLAKNLRLELKELHSLKKKLELVDAFLLWKGIPGQYDYDKLDDAEEIFKQLEKAIKKFTKADDKRQALQMTVFTLIENPPSTGRLYSYVMDLIRSFDKIYDRIREDEVAANSGEQVPTQPDDVEVLESLLNNNPEPQQPVPSMFGNPQSASAKAKTLVDTIADVKAENKEKTNTEAVYEAVSDALRQLQGLAIENDTAKIESIINKLEQLIVSASSLLKQAKEFNTPE